VNKGPQGCGLEEKMPAGRIEKKEVAGKSIADPGPVKTQAVR